MHPFGGGRLVVALAAALLAGAAANNNGLGARPAMGWSTWCTMARCYQPPPNATAESAVATAAAARGYHDVCNEAEILSVAQAMVANGMRDAGYTHIAVDDCWADVARDASGQLQGDPSRFPNGMKSFIDQLHALGFTVGLYTSAGLTTCSSGGRPKPIPGSYGHYEQDARTYAAWGADWMTFDWCDWHWNDTVLLPPVQTKQMWKALNDSGRPIWFNFHCIGYGLQGSEWCAEYGNSYTILVDHHDNWNSTIELINALAVPADYAGPFAWPDPDFLMTGGAGCDDPTPGKRCPGQTDEEYRTEFSLWALAGGQLLVSADVRNISALQRELLLNREVLDVFNDGLGILGRRLTYDIVTATSSWARPLADGCSAVALLNAGAAPHSVGCPFPLVNTTWTAATTATVRDLWALQDQGTATGRYTATVGPHQTKLVKLCAR